MQSRLQSLSETLLSVLIGYLVALVSQLMIFPWFAIQVTFRDNLLIGLYFTLISILRSYAVRRLFNSFHKP
jgi:F0F1-type ATP synthase assembly protein I